MSCIITLYIQVQRVIYDINTNKYINIHIYTQRLQYKNQLPSSALLYCMYIYVVQI